MRMQIFLMRLDFCDMTCYFYGSELKDSGLDLWFDLFFISGGRKITFLDF